MKTPDRSESGPTPHGTRQSRSALGVLAIGIPGEVLSNLKPNLIDPDQPVASTAFDALHMALEPAIALVLSPLVTPQFDVIDVAKRLQDLRFPGRYLALAEKLPEPRLIRAEVSRAAPQVNFDVIVMDGSPPLRSL